MFAAIAAMISASAVAADVEMPNIASLNANPNEIISSRDDTGFVMSFGIDGQFKLGAGVTPEQAASKTFSRNEWSHDFCDGWRMTQDVIAEDEPGSHVENVYTMDFVGKTESSGKVIGVTTLPTGVVKYSGFEPSPDAKRFFQKAAEIVKCG